MAQQVRHRPQAATIPYSTNNREAKPLSRGMIYRELGLRLTGQPTVTTANNTVAKAQHGDEWGVIKKIEIVANGTDVLKSFDGNALFWMNYFMFGAAPLVTAALGNGSANPAFDSFLILPFWMPRSIKPMDTALDSRTLSSLEIAITWGTFTDVSLSASAWTAEPSLEVFSLESFNAEGPFSQWRTWAIEKEITATNPRFQIDLPVGKMFRGFMINTQDGGVDQGDIMNNFKLISGSTVFADVKAGANVLQEWYRLRNGVTRPWDAAAQTYDKLRRGTANSLNGWYFFDQVTDGFLTEAIDTLGFSEIKMELDVTVGAGATKVVVYPIEIVPVRG